MARVRKAKLIGIGIGVTVLLLTAGVVAAVTITDLGNEEVFFGEVGFVESDLAVTDVETDGPGINYDEVTVSVENSGNEDITGDVEVALFDTDGEIITNPSDEVTVTGGGTAEVTFDIDRVNANDVDEIETTITNTDE